MKLLTLTRIAQTAINSLVQLFKPTNFAVMMSVVMMVIFLLFVSIDCGKFEDVESVAQCRKDSLSFIRDFKEILDD